MIEPEERILCADGIFWEQKFGCNDQGVIAAFFIAKKEKTVILEERIVSREEKRGLDRERREIESKFAKEHEKDSDEELLDIVRNKANELGRPPKKTETIGFVCLKMRFGPWPRVLEKAGLKKPRTNRRKPRELSP